MTMDYRLLTFIQQNIYALQAVVCLSGEYLSIALSRKHHESSD
ncbi:MAG: hypothetical protein VKL59_06700 [Nostocaceae cyanobacterium]|nr:hypothetical protein [Nostocaceae cyanobacterium]